MAGSSVRNVTAICMLACAFAAFQPSRLHAQINAPAAKTALETTLGEAALKARPIADMSSQYVRPGYVEGGPVRPGYVERGVAVDKKKGKFEFFDVDNLAGMAGGAIAAGIADQRRAEYYRQDFFYGGRPYYGSPYYGGPAYYGGPYSTYYLKK